MSIHKTIREGRARLNMTEQQFADAVGVSRGAVQQWEKEGGTAPNRARQPIVAQLLGISVSELMTGAVEPKAIQEKTAHFAAVLRALPESIRESAAQKAIAVLLDHLPK